MAQYALESTNQPIGISEYQLSKLMPENIQSQLPTIEDIEATLSDIKETKDWYVRYQYEKPTAADCKSALKWSNLLVGIEDLKSFGKSLDSWYSDIPIGSLYDLIRVFCYLLR